MSQQYDDSNRGALFKNDRKESDKQPDYRGSLNVAGHDYWISAWLKEDRNGKKYMSLSVQQKDGQPRDAQRPAQTAPARRSMKDEMDDGVPF